MLGERRGRGRALANFTWIVVLAICTSFVASTGAPAGATPLLWGVDEDDGQLFSIGDYTTPSSTFTNYGRLKHGGSYIGAHIEAFTIDPSDKRTAYMARNANLGGFSEPAFFKLDLNTVVFDPTVTLIGRIDVTFNNDNDNITGLAFHPSTGDLYALFRNDGSSDVDKLLKINKATGAVISTIGSIEGMSRIVGKGEDLVFDHLGNLYVTDHRNGNRLYKVDPSTGAIIAILDDDLKGGLGVSSVKFEGLAWDFQSNKLIGTEDYNGLFAEITFPGNGSNISFGTVSGLTDVEGIAFVPNFDTPTPVPEPGTLLLLGSGLASLGGAAWRRGGKCPRSVPPSAP